MTDRRSRSRSAAHDLASGPSRRATLLGAVLAIGAPALTACRPGSSGAAEKPAALEYLVIGDQDWMARATDDLSAFASTQPGFSASARNLARPGYDDEAAQLAVAADPPALMWHNISRARFADLVTAGAATDLTHLWTTALSGVSPAVSSWYTMRGGRYAVPLNIDLYPIICYDVALFRRLGITPPPAGTRSWSEAEFLDACAVLRAAGLDPLAVSGLDLSQQLVEAIAVTTLSAEQLRRYTVDAWRPGSGYRYTDDAWTQVFARLQKWARANVFQPRSAWTDQVAAMRAFVGGVSGMVAGGSWTVGGLTQLAADAGANPELDWMVFPTITHPSPLLSFPGDGAFIPAAGPQRVPAEQLLAFMLRPERMLAAAKAHGHIPPLNIPGLGDALDPLVVSMLEVSTRLGGACMNWPTELDAPFARVCRAALAGTSTPQEAGQDLEDAASLVRTS
ncbi:MAG TPA: ABC transporter substrate-binding protein [Kineosporiaceae bacterium]|nr:ABC transporter substrate-binding protein [Kineosporiaceae bacterium]